MVFGKSLLLMIPFAFVLISIKFEARKFKNILVRNSPDNGGHYKHGRGLQSRYTDMGPNDDILNMRLSNADHDSQSNFVFNANINGQEFHLDLNYPDFGEIDSMVNKMMNQG